MKASRLASMMRFILVATVLSLIIAFSARAQAPAAAPSAAPADAAPAGAEPAATAPEAAAPASEPATEAPATQPAPPPGVNLPGKDPLEENFNAYLYFAGMGQFEIADKFAKSFLQLPGVSERPMPKEVADRVLQLSVREPSSVDRLITIIDKTPIADNAKKVLEWRKKNMFKHQVPYKL